MVREGGEFCLAAGRVARSVVQLWLISLIFGGCTGGSAEVDEVREVDAGLTAIELSVLGFEDVSQWTLEHVSKMTDSVTSRKPITFRQGSTDGTSADLPS